MTQMESLFPGNQLIEGRQVRDLYELREFVDACIEATGNVVLDVPMDMRLIKKVNPRTARDIYDLEITRW
jgi:hypothetical protein